MPAAPMKMTRSVMIVTYAKPRRRSVAPSAAKPPVEATATARDVLGYPWITSNTQDEANQIWNAIRTTPDWKNEIVADIKATGAQGGTSRTTPPTMYTVKAGGLFGVLVASWIVPPALAWYWSPGWPATRSRCRPWSRFQK